jgi:hypothetical protein
MIPMKNVPLDMAIQNYLNLIPIPNDVVINTDINYNNGIEIFF